MSFLKPSFISLVFVISFLNWTSIARLTRSEYLKAKKMDYVLAYQAMGMANMTIIFKKILPNVFTVIAIQLIYVMASAMIIEASLSFVGLGLSDGNISWGTIIADAREKYTAWWLIIFPGMCLTYTIYMLNNVRINMQQQIRK